MLNSSQRQMKATSIIRMIMHQLIKTYFSRAPYKNNNNNNNKKHKNDKPTPEMCHPRSES